MCERCDVAKEVVLEYLSEHPYFTLEDVVHYVSEKANTTRIAPNVTVKDYLKSLERVGFCKEVRFNEYVSVLAFLRR